MQMAGVVTLTDHDFQAQVLDSDVPVLVDFWAPWCGPCRRIAPELEALANDPGGTLRVAKVNIDENRRSARRYGVVSIPTLILFINGHEQTRLRGARPRRAIEAHIQPYLTDNGNRRTGSRGDLPAPSPLRVTATDVKEAPLRRADSRRKPLPR